MPFKIKKQLIIQTEDATSDDFLGFIFKDGTCVILALDPNHEPATEDRDYHLVIKKKPFHMGEETEELTESDMALLQHSVVRIRKVDVILKEPLEGMRQSPHDETNFETFKFADGSPLIGVYPASPS